MNIQDFRMDWLICLLRYLPVVDLSTEVSTSVLSTEIKRKRERTDQREIKIFGEPT